MMDPELDLLLRELNDLRHERANLVTGALLLRAQVAALQHRLEAAQSEVVRLLGLLAADPSTRTPSA